MAEKHVADAESTWKVCNINPDMCIVNGKVVPFEIYQVLTPEKSNYARTVQARGCRVLKVDSIIKGVIGNAGKGVSSGVSRGSGDTQVLKGASSVHVEGKPGARHLDLCDMNVQS